MLQKVSILVNDYTQSQGVNSVVDQFIVNRELFGKQDIEINGVLDSSKFYHDVPKRNPNISVNNVKQILKTSFIYKWKLTQKLIFFKKSYLIGRYAGRNALNQSNDNIILFQDVFAAYYCLRKRRNFKCIYMTHMHKDELEQFLMSYSSLKGTWLEKKIRGIYAYVYNHADQIVTICNIARDSLLTKTPKANVQVIRNAIDNQPVPEKSSTDKINIVSASSINYRKGSDLLLDAILSLNKEIMEQVEFHIYGSGDYLQVMRNKISEKKLDNVHLYGNISSPYTNYGKMDCFIMTSRNETSPMSILEAMRAGLPVVTTNVGAISEMMKEGVEGFFIDLDVESIVLGIKRIVEERDKLPMYGVNARKTFEQNFTSKEWVQSFSDLFHEVGR